LKLIKPKKPRAKAKKKPETEKQPIGVGARPAKGDAPKSSGSHEPAADSGGEPASETE
jgi:hypothetical protein